MKNRQFQALKDLVIDQIRDLVFWIHPNGDIIYVNQTVLTTLGYTEVEIYQKKKAWDIVKDFSEKQWIKSVLELKQKQKHSFRTIHQRKNRTTYPTDTTLFYTEFNQEVCICAIVRNREKIEQVTDQLHFSQFTIEKADDMILWVTKEGKVIHANESACYKMGYSFEEFTKLGIPDFDPYHTVASYQKAWEEVKDKKVRLVETEILLKSGKLMPVEIKSNYVNHNGIEYNCAFFRDITARKQYEIALKRRQEELQNIIQTATDAIVTADKHGNILQWNRAATRIFGWTVEEMHQKSLKKIIPGKFQKAHEHGMNRYMTTNEPKVIGKTVELEAVRKDGTIFPIEISLANWQAEEEHFFCGIIRDITNRKAKENRFQQLLTENQRLQTALEAENTYLQEEIRQAHNFDEIISSSDRYATEVLAKIEEVAATNATVLITGETGTGKELIARATHHLSDRNNRPLVKINCATLPENLIESELFGHEKGAFTGAINKKIGRFELADGGTIFLDEIGELPIALQSKLLRVLQEGEFSRLGGNDTLTTDVRLVAATNRNLPELIKSGEFREDLYYRLNVFPIHNLPLRERKEDIPLLVKHFRYKFNERLGRKVTKISKRAMDKLRKYDYPGNIRELENIIERAIITSKGETLNLNHWSPNPTDKPTETALVPFETMQKNYIIKVLKSTDWKVSGENGAAEILELKAKTLESKMRKLGIRRKDFMK